MDDIESIGKVTLGPDDVVVVRAKGALSQQHEAAMNRKLEEVFPKNKVMVLQMGDTLEVVAPKDADVLKQTAYDGPTEAWKEEANAFANTMVLRDYAEHGVKPFDGKLLPSSVDKLKAREELKAGPALDELLEAVDHIERNHVVTRDGDYVLRADRIGRLQRTARAVRQRRDELPEPMGGA